MSNTPKLGLPEFAPAQALPETKANDVSRRVEQGAGLFIVADKDATSPPGSPAQGVAYIVAASATGAWSGHDGEIAYYQNTAWKFIVPGEGFFAWVLDESALYHFLSSAWSTYAVGGLGTASTLDFDTDGTLAANSDSKIATQKAVKTFVASRMAGLLDYQGDLDCSANPNYPAASKGDAYTVSVAGKVGGGSGTSVDVGDTVIAKADNAGGTQASVGASWFVLEHNLSGVLLLSGGTLTGALHVPDDAYDATGWNGSTEVPTKNALRDKIEGIIAGVPSAYTDEMARDAVMAMISGTGLLTETENDAGDTDTITVLASSTTDVLNGTATTSAVTPDALAALWEKGADVASAGTVSLGEGGSFHITGTATITDIDPATDKAGRFFVLTFDGSLTLTHNASTLILPTGANIQTAAGDTAIFVSEGSDVVRCVGYQRADGSWLAPRIQSVASSATVTPTFANDQVNVTAQAAALALANPTGTAQDGFGISIRIKDNGTARAISYGTQYRAIGVTLPTTTVISKTLYLGMIFNNADTKWDVVAVAQEA
jgi:hypothetical protein